MTAPITWTPADIVAVADVIRAYLDAEDPDVSRQLFNQDVEEIAMRAWPVVERLVRARVAADIEASLAEDLADSDVSSGEAIWAQGGYRNGLGAAADIARS